MPLVHEQSFRVRFHDSDMHRLVRDASYLRYMQEAAFAASAAAGYPEERYHAIRRLWLIRETFLDMHSPLCYGDSVRIKTWVESFGKVRSRRRLRTAAGWRRGTGRNGSHRLGADRPGHRAAGHYPRRDDRRLQPRWSGQRSSRSPALSCHPACATRCLAAAAGGSVARSGQRRPRQQRRLRRLHPGRRAPGSGGAGLAGRIA